MSPDAPSPPSSSSEPGAAPESLPTPEAVATAGGSVPLEPGATRVTLELSPHLAGPESAGLEEVLRTAGEGTEPTLVIRDLRAATPPGVLYHLYVGLAEDEEPAQDDPRYVGSIQFFDAVPEKDGFFTFSLGPQLEHLRRERAWSGPLTVTLRPTGPPEEGAEATLGAVELILP